MRFFTHFKQPQIHYYCIQALRKLDCLKKHYTLHTLRRHLLFDNSPVHQRQRCHHCQIWTIIASSVPQGSFVSVQHSSLSLFVIPTCKKQYFCATPRIWGSPPASRLGGWSVYVFNIFRLVLLGNRLGVAWPWVYRNNGRQLTGT